MSVESATRRLFAAILIQLVAFCPIAGAQCDPHWLRGEGALHIAGDQNVVFSAACWDPDGPGPLPPRVVVGGRFGVGLTTNVAQMTEYGWQPMGDGLNGRVNALVVLDGALIAGGEFTASAGTSLSRVARWDGAAWQPIGPGLPFDVTALGEFDGQLVAGGTRISRWTGSAWEDLGAWPVGVVLAFTMFEGELVAGGGILQGAAGHIARLRNAVWEPMGSNITRVARSLIVYQNELYAGAQFDIAGVGVRSPGRWDGQNWVALGPGLQYFEVEDMMIHDGELVIAGWDTEASGDANVIRIWDGSSWRELSPTLRGYARSHLLCNGTLVTAGSFVVGPHDIILASTFLARLVDSAWRPEAWGIRSVRSLHEFQGELIAGGSFWYMPGTRANNIAKWDGLEWSPLGTGVAYTRSHPVTSMAQGLTMHEGDLVVAGVFDNVGENISRWTGSHWQPDLALLSSNAKTDVALLDGRLVVGGFLLHSAPTGVARLDGPVWEPLTPGPRHVRALAVVNGVLFAGGQTAFSGSHVARWDGTAWSALGALPGVVHVLGEHDNELIAGGTFAGAGGLSRIARWDGSAWTALGSGIAGTGVYALHEFDGDLIVGGHFASAGGAPASNIARWDGANWWPLGSGVRAGWEAFPSGQGVHALGEFNGELIVGGQFEIAGDMLSGSLARWTATGVPWVAKHPASQVGTMGNDVIFEAAAAPGYAGVTHQWRLNGVPLTDGPTPHGSMISGSESSGLTISGVQMADAGEYDCSVGTICGAVLSAPAYLVVHPECYANCEGTTIPPILTVEDFYCFIDSFTEGLALPHEQQVTHYANCDGSTVAPVLNVDDFTCFINQFAIGCP